MSLIYISLVAILDASRYQSNGTEIDFLSPLTTANETLSPVRGLLEVEEYVAVR